MKIKHCQMANGKQREHLGKAFRFNNKKVLVDPNKSSLAFVRGFQGNGGC